MAIYNSKRLQKLFKTLQKQLGRNLTSKELVSILNGDNSVLKKEKVVEEKK